MDSTMPTVPFDYHALDYETFAQALLNRMDLRGEVRVLPYAMEVNPKGNLDAYIVLWMIAHAHPEDVQAAEDEARRKSVDKP
jgi:hypothetical protein